MIGTGISSDRMYPWYWWTPWPDRTPDFRVKRRGLPGGGGRLEV